MSSNDLTVFFYGLFMDESVLAAKGIEPSRSMTGYVDGYRLRLGRRATLVPEPAGRTYGVVMAIGRDQVADLYADESVADYVPESVSVVLSGGMSEPAVCYILPPRMLEGVNPEYAGSLLLLARKLGFPDSYLDVIRKEGEPR